MELVFNVFTGQKRKIGGNPVSILGSWPMESKPLGGPTGPAPGRKGGWTVGNTASGGQGVRRSGSTLTGTGFILRPQSPREGPPLLF